jgi:hypothetical protein
MQPEEAAMLKQHELKILADARSDAWKNVNFAKVNGLEVRLRIVMDRAARANCDELFSLKGVAHLDTSDSGTPTLKPHQRAVVTRNTLRRLRLEGRAVELVIDTIRG